MYMTSAKDIWVNLEKRFALTNGSRKYKLCKDLYALKQNTLSITEYYTSMKTVWEELDSMNMLPSVTNPSAEVLKLLETINTQKEESRLFQFLNGLNEVFYTQRSNLLMHTPLPVVETACAILEQEEAQRAVLHTSSPMSNEILAMYGKAQQDRPIVCTVCGVKGHTGDKCWQVIGFPRWHPRNNRQNPAFKPKNFVQNTTNRWSGPQKPTPAPRLAAVAHNSPTCDSVSSQNTSGLLFTPQQLDQLMKLMPQLQTGHTKDSDTDEELDHHFSGMITCHTSQGLPTDWIIDSGASDHMTPNLSALINSRPFNLAQNINMPTGATAAITHTGMVCLTPDLILKGVLCVPGFQHNLLSVQRLIKDGHCEVQFFSTHCTIVDSETHQLKGIGRARNGLYYLDTKMKPHSVMAAVSTATGNLLPSTLSSTHSEKLALWHHRLGHASLSKLKYIPCVQPYTHNAPQICLTCPMSKFAKLPFTDSQSHASSAFELIHLDIWGPYKLPYNGKYRFFLTLVDDHSRHTWIIFSSINLTLSQI